MDYYRCPIEDLHKEIHRRGYSAFGTSDQLSESLQIDDEKRGTDATTVKTQNVGIFVPRELHRTRTVEFGETVPANSLIGEKITYWAMNTFFPTLQLFFESGSSCTIDGGQLSDAKVGLDYTLRFRLTDCTHEEDGHVIKSSLPEKFAKAGAGLVVREAVIAQRKSIAVQPVARQHSSTKQPPLTTITQEAHAVVGLRLDGMSRMAYVWAKVEKAPTSEGKKWGDVRIAGMRKDVPAPSLNVPKGSIKPGGEVSVVAKQSLISAGVLEAPMRKPLER